MLRKWIVRIRPGALVPTSWSSAVEALRPTSLHPRPLTAWGQWGLDPGEFYLLEWVAVAPVATSTPPSALGQQVQHLLRRHPARLVGTHGEAPWSSRHRRYRHRRRRLRLRGGRQPHPEVHRRRGSSSPVGRLGPGDRRPVPVAGGHRRRRRVRLRGRQRQRPDQKFTAAGAFVTMWGSRAPGAGQFDEAEGIAVRDGTVYVVDSFNHRVQLLDHRHLPRRLGHQPPGPVPGPGRGSGSTPTATSTSPTTATTGSRSSPPPAPSAGAPGVGGHGLGQFRDPHGVAVDQASGDLYVAELNNNRVQAFGYQPSRRPDQEGRRRARGRQGRLQHHGRRPDPLGQGPPGWLGHLLRERPERRRLRRGPSPPGTAPTTRFCGAVLRPDRREDHRRGQAGRTKPRSSPPEAKFKVKVVVTVRHDADRRQLTGSLTATSTTHPTFKDKVGSSSPAACDPDLRVTAACTCDGGSR